MDANWTPFSKYVTLVSTASSEYFPSNTTSSFKNKLLVPIKCDETLPLEVGITDLWYYPKADLSQSQTIFGHEHGDNVISIWKRPQAELYIYRKEGDDFEQTFNDINTLLHKYFPDMSFGLQYDENDEADLIFLNKYENQFAELRADYAEAFGFDVRVFRAGETHSKNRINRELLKKIDVYSPLVIKVFSETAYSAQVEEPVEKTVNGLITSINKSLADYKLKFIYDGSRVTIEGIYGSGYTVRLSSQLEGIFGLNSPYEFDYNFPSCHSNASIDLGVSSDQLVVLSNIVEQQYLGKYSPPYIGIFSSDKVKSTFRSSEAPIATHKCRPWPIYCPVRSMTSIDEIEIQLCDENLAHIPPTQDKHTAITLHFRNQRF